jgi:DNA modification methylase
MRSLPLPDRHASAKKSACKEVLLSKENQIRRMEDLSVAYLDPATLKLRERNPRTHSKKQIQQIAASIKEFGFVTPILIDGEREVVAGHGRIEAAKLNGMKAVPTIRIDHLTPQQVRAYVIADNQLATKAGWERDFLKLDFRELLNIEYDVELTGFSTGEVDMILDFDSPTAKDDPEDDDLSALTTDGPAISRVGDMWQLGPHRLLCADARHPETYRTLLGDDVAQMVLTDAPYNVRVVGHVQGRGKRKHREFAMASGEMSDAQFLDFLETVMNRAVEFSADGSIHYWFMDWRHLPVLHKAANPLYSEWKNVLVWCKPNPGQGSFYRSQHELIAVFKSGTKPHINNFGLGAEGRSRSNVLEYPGIPGIDKHREEELAMHPTVKPVPLIADLIRDCSKRGGIILDMFGGSCPVLLGAERTGRRARIIEIDPHYVDLGIRRWEKMTGDKAALAGSGDTFTEVQAHRMSAAETAVPTASKRKRA